MSHPQKRVVITQDIYNQPEEPFVQFRLTYDGPLRSTQRKKPSAEERHDLRRKFHAQLRRLWEINPFLKTGDAGGPEFYALESSREPSFLKAEELAAIHRVGNFQFVPLVTKRLDLICGLDILFLRQDKPGNLWRGDIDNRIKTLIDTLKKPDADDKYYLSSTPAADEMPLYCLLEDDALISKVAVESDQRLQVAPSGDIGEVALVITVNLRPYGMHVGNIPFG